MKPGEGFRQAFVIAGEAAEAGHPAEGALHDPPSGQEDEAALGLGSSDDIEGDAVGGRGFGGPLAGVSLVDIGEFHSLAGRVLDGLGQGGRPNGHRHWQV